MMRTPVDDRPPRWAGRLLTLSLPARDRETIAGDLLEEYREVVLPTRGRWRAQLWYVRQALSLIDGLTLGVALGAVAGAWNLLYTHFDPLADDTPLALLGFYGPLFAAYAIAGFSAARRGGRVLHALRSGATVAFATFVVFFAAILLRVNLYLDAIRHRDDWRSLVAGYHASGFESLRTYANYVYLTGAPLKILVSVAIGAAFGWIGGLVASLGRQRRSV